MSNPALFVSHGSPMMAIEPDATSAMFEALGRVLEQPRAIVMVSAHHATAAPSVGSGAALPTIHDFGGFPREMYQLHYPARGSSTVADRVVQLLEQSGLPVTRDARRGLDHGAWVPLQYMYPTAPVPIVPLSIQPRLDARHHYLLGRALQPLRAEGVLVIGTGNLTHNLYEIDPRARPGEAAPYASAFQAWFAERLAAGNTEALLDWERQAPDGSRAHPTDEHLLPLFVAYGAGATADVAPRSLRLHDQIVLGVLAMDAYAFDTDPAALARLEPVARAGSAA